MDTPMANPAELGVSMAIPGSEPTPVSSVHPLGPKARMADLPLPGSSYLWQGWIDPHFFLKATTVKMQ